MKETQIPREWADLVAYSGPWKRVKSVGTSAVTSENHSESQSRGTRCPRDLEINEL